jgi:hypothetical protein
MGEIMFNTLSATLSAVISAAAIAAFVTFILPGAQVDAGPLAKPAEQTLKACKQMAWPYLNCVGTEIGNQRIRLVTTDRLDR